MKAPFRSIRWQLQIWHGVILLLALAAVCVTVHQLAWDNLLRRIDMGVRQSEWALIRAVMDSKAAQQGTEPQPLPPGEIVKFLQENQVTLPAATAALFQGKDPGHGYFSFRDAKGRVLWQSSNLPNDVLMLPVPEKEYVDEVRTVATRRERSRSSAQGLRSVVGRDITNEIEEMRGFAWSLAVAGAGVWFVGLLGGWWLAGRALRPIRSISDTATRIAAGNLGDRIETTGAAIELEQLSTVLNQTFEQLHAAFERQKQFTADAAHELRTPVTIILSETQRILKRDRSGEEYREVVETCGATAVRMRHLIEDLLLLARQETPGAGLKKEQCDLEAIAGETIQHLRPLAAEKGIEIHTDLQPATCFADSAAIRMVMSNLLANAIQHHPGEGNVFLKTRSKGDEVSLTIRDDGNGIDPADLPHIFERFYRADKARTGNGAVHSGLGLAIVQSIVDAHRGEVNVQSSPGKGATFEVALPADRSS